MHVIAGHQVWDDVPGPFFWGSYHGGTPIAGEKTGHELGAKDSPPASRVLGYEIRERLLPMGQEIYALGNVAWRFRASVGISQGNDVGSFKVVKSGPMVAAKHRQTLVTSSDWDTLW